MTRTTHPSIVSPPDDPHGISPSHRTPLSDSPSTARTLSLHLRCLSCSQSELERSRLEVSIRGHLAAIERAGYTLLAL